MGSPRTWQLIAAIALIAAMIYLIRYSTTFFTQQNQILLGWGCLAVIYLMYKFKITRQQPWRMMFMILAIILALRYILWRIFETPSSPIVFIFDYEPRVLSNSNFHAISQFQIKFNFSDTTRFIIGSLMGNSKRHLTPLRMPDSRNKKKREQLKWWCPSYM